ncbi:hypothetical protein BDN67DRAFT_973168 [Paxillus ammoniavirescens]|nr:hypothetical protein BDN67DRAFT_973168 [Paxillus ammoniavirescens]
MCTHGRRIALSADTGQVFTFGLESGSLTTTCSSHAMAVHSLAWSYNGQVSYRASILIGWLITHTHSSRHRTTSDSFYMMSVRQPLENRALVRLQP